MKRRKVTCPRCHRVWIIEKKDMDPVLHRCSDQRIRPIRDADR